jgi:hypothetical protein
MQIEMKKCMPRNEVALGATLGSQHMENLYQSIAKQAIPVGEIIILNFKGIEQVNGSYIKTTALWVFLCGQMAVNAAKASIPPRHFSDLRPYDLYVAVSNLAPDVRNEFNDFLQPRRIPMLLAKRFNDKNIEEAVLLGHLDDALRMTLEALVKHGVATAPRLSDLYPNVNITVTAWNNRLNDLHALRLVRRVRSGRSWEYQPLTKKIIWE